MTHAEIYAVYMDHLTARTKAGFSMPGSRAVEDTAYECDTSIHEVCIAISVMEQAA